MINLVRILEDRTLLMSSKRIGVTGENNAEILKFIFPEKINRETSSSLSKKVYFYNDEVTYSYPIENDEFKINSDLTIYESLLIMVKIFRNDEMIFKTIPEEIYIVDGENEGGTNPAEEQRSKDLNNVRASFTENVGGDYSEYEWEELIGSPSEHGYHTGVLYGLRSELAELAESAVDGATAETITISESVELIDTAISDMKSDIEDYNQFLTGVEEILGIPEVEGNE